MWVIFLLSAMTVSICIFIIAYIGNKILIAMENDRKKNNKKKRSRKETKK